MYYFDKNQFAFYLVVFDGTLYISPRTCQLIEADFSDLDLVHDVLEPEAKKGPAMGGPAMSLGRPPQPGPPISGPPGNDDLKPPGSGGGPGGPPRMGKFSSVSDHLFGIIWLQNYSFSVRNY